MPRRGGGVTDPGVLLSRAFDGIDDCMKILISRLVLPANGTSGRCAATSAEVRRGEEKAASGDVWIRQVLCARRKGAVCDLVVLGEVLE